jgi:DNA-binding transcriptional regulator LsrR (DeoR family)
MMVERLPNPQFRREIITSMKFPDDYTVAYTYWMLLKPRERRLQNVADLLGIQVPRERKEAIRILNRLGRALRRYEEQELVRHRVLSKDSEAAGRADRIPELEEELRHCFALRHAVVVDASVGVADDDFELDDLVHRRLGAWGGRILNVCLRGADDVIGVGGGRGPYYTVASCQFNRMVDYPDRIISLTGQINATDWRPRTSAFLDADRVAGDLANILSIPTPVRKLGHGIVKAAGISPLSTDKVTFALTGVGALAGGHRLLNFDQYRELDAVRPELEQLAALARNLDDPNCDPPYFCVGDLCNRLFVCEPHHSPHGRAQEYAKLSQLVESLGERFVCPTFAQMRDICARGGVLAVCGGRYKVTALRHLLRQERPLISHLITDRVCAEKILKLEGAADIRRQWAAHSTSG